MAIDVHICYCYCYMHCHFNDFTPSGEVYRRLDQDRDHRWWSVCDPSTPPNSSSPWRRFYVKEHLHRMMTAAGLFLASLFESLRVHVLLQNIWVVMGHIYIYIYIYFDTLGGSQCYKDGACNQIYQNRICVRLACCFVLRYRSPPQS